MVDLIASEPKPVINKLRKENFGCCFIVFNVFENSRIDTIFLEGVLNEKGVDC